MNPAGTFNHVAAAVMAATLGRCRVYRGWQSTSARISSAGGLPIWLSAEGEAAEPGLYLGKRSHDLLVYRSGGSSCKSAN